MKLGIVSQILLGDSYVGTTLSPAIAFILLMLISSTAPFLLSVAAESNEDSSSAPAYNAGGTIIGDLEDFDPSTMEVSICLFTKMNPLSPPHSSCGKHGLTPGRPGVDDMVINPQWAVQALGLAIRTRWATP